MSYNNKWEDYQSCPICGIKFTGINEVNNVYPASEQGYVYVLYNEVFEHYGPNVYKLGKSTNPDKRLCQYTPSYMMPSKLEYVSDLVSDCSVCELLCFYSLKYYRTVSNREFFQCKLSVICNQIKQVVSYLNSCTCSVINHCKTCVKRNVKINMDSDETIMHYINMHVRSSDMYEFVEQKTIHCLTFGLHSIDVDFHNSWIRNNRYQTMINLVTYLKLHSGNINGDEETGDSLARYKLFMELLDISGFNLNSYLFVGLPQTEFNDDMLSDSQKEFLLKNKRKFKRLFGSLGRIRGNPTREYHMFKILSRVMESYLGLEFKCTRRQITKNGSHIYKRIYSMSVPDEIYELLTYRMLAERRDRMRNIFNLGICEKLQSKFDMISHQWARLAAISECIEVEPNKRIELKLRVNAEDLPCNSVKRVELKKRIKLVVKHRVERIKLVVKHRINESVKT